MNCSDSDQDSEFDYYREDSLWSDIKAYSLLTIFFLLAASIGVQAVLYVAN